jgi:hypothetical protein
VSFIVFPSYCGYYTMNIKATDTHKSASISVSNSDMKERNRFFLLLSELSARSIPYEVRKETGFNRLIVDWEGADMCGVDISI